MLEDKTVFNLMSKLDKYPEMKELTNGDLSESCKDYHHFGISVKENINLDRLKSELVEVVKSGVDENAVIITNSHHKEALMHALQAIEDVENGMKIGLTGDLLAFHLCDTIRHIGYITVTCAVDIDLIGSTF